MKQTSNEIMKNLERIQGKDTYTLLHDFFIMSAISIRNSVDHRPNQYEAHENRYKSIAKNYNGNELKIISESFAMLYKEYQQILNGDKPFCDLLGELYMSSNTSNGKAGQFFTPYCLSQMCAISAINEDEAKERIEKDPHDVLSVLEPSCGAGGMLVAAAERLQNIGVNYAYNSVMYAVDVDERREYSYEMDIVIRWLDKNEEAHEEPNGMFKPYKAKAMQQKIKWLDEHPRKQREV